MKKTLSTILLGISLSFGVGNKLKAQEFQSDFVNNDGDDFPEEVFGVYEIEKNEFGGKGIIYYFDKDNDNFHEGIREIFPIKRCNNTKCRRPGYSIRIREFYISKSSGLIDISYKRYILNLDGYQRYSSGMSYKDIAKISILPLRPAMEGSWKVLTEYDLYKTFGTEFGDRVKRLINVGTSKNMEELKILAEEQRRYWENKN